jgi:hypothetical protein
MKPPIQRLSHRFQPYHLPALCLVAVTLGLADPASGQAPATDIFVADMSHDGDRITLSGWRNVTDRNEYDNQPSFMPDGGSLLYTSGRGGQTDTYRYDLSTGQSTPVTQTPESEYSPTVMPGGQRFSAIRVEADSTQRLWSFALDGTSPQVLLTEVAPVGYHAWATPDRVALFVLGSPPTLQLADISSGAVRQREESIGRSLHPIPDQLAVSFLHKGEEWWIKALDLEQDRVTTIVRAVEGSEDYAWTPGGLLLMGSGSKLFVFDPKIDSDWRLVADLAAEGINGVTRLAASPNGTHLALVAVRPQG